MPIIIFILFFLLKIFCSIKIIPISEVVKGDILTEYFLYCAKSPNGYINLFYKIAEDNYHLVYDKNEDYVIKYINTKKNVKKLEYLNSDKEYLMLTKDIYYINENDNIEEFISGNDDFFILSNKDFITIDYKVSLKNLKYYLEIDYFTYPYKYDNKISSSLSDVFVKHYEIIEVSNVILFFLLLDEEAITNKLDLYILDKKTKKINKAETLHEKITGFTLINLNNISDDFIYCISELMESSRCFKAKYENKKITREKSIDVFTWECLLTKDFHIFRKNYAILNDGKIAILCSSSHNIYLTIFQYKDKNLILSDFKNKEIIKDTSYNINIQNYFLVYNSNKGLILYNIIEYSKNFTYAVYKLYIEESCSSFDILTNEYKETEISFIDYITGGINDSKPNFMITEIDPRITLYNNNKKIIAGNTEYNNNDKFSFISPFSETPLIIKFQNTKSDYSCRAIISIFYYKIQIKDKSYKCDRSPNISIINNITDHDLNKSFDINIDKSFYFSVEYISSVLNKDLIYKYSNQQFLCKKNSFYSTKIDCKLPINLKLIPPNSLKNEYNIYSNLSCLNTFYIGTVAIEDPYLIEIIEADNLTTISQNINKAYDSSQKIKEFSVDMINYYYWFPSFAYCDEEYIQSGECCQEEILTDWEIFSYKKYSYSLDSIGLFDLKQIKKRVAEINELNEEEVEIDMLFDYDIFKYVILKSEKFKKYIISFAGSNILHNYISKIMFSKLVNFEKDENIKVNNFFYLVFNLTTNDVFTQTFLKDMAKNIEYQIIFTGHSFGGAIATLASYYYAKHNLAKNEPVLITFGQPRVGNENFARDYMKIISNVYRIERYNDFASMLPPIKKQDDIYNINEFKKVKIIYSIITLKNVPGTISGLTKVIKIVGFDDHIPDFEIKEYIAGNLKTDIVDLAFDVIDVYLTEISSQYSNLIPYGYCHIGGLYVLNEDWNKFYHCKDIYNEEVTSPYCKNKDFQFGNLKYDVKEYNFYFTDRQNPIERCQAFKYGERFLIYP